VRYGLTNTAGIVDQESNVFQENNREAELLEILEQSENNKNKISDEMKGKIYCKINAIADFAPANAEQIRKTYENTKSDVLVSKMIFAVTLRLSQSDVFNRKMEMCDGLGKDGVKFPANIPGDQNIFPWMNNDEWHAIAEATIKDKSAIVRAGEMTGIEPRLIVSCMIVEQLRLFNSQRELFKKFFQPLKILGNANKISLGVMGIKETTATQIESHLVEINSPYYLGKNYEHSLDSISGSTFDRLTSEKENHYNSYLYGALYLKQMMNQWQKAGYDIQYRPEIVGTLFNVGFPQSRPKAEPKVGGSAITIGEAKYSFGSLAYEFYYSGEMQSEFPYIVK